MTSFEPHAYQRKAIEFALDNDRCGLFLPMGAGKTVTTLTIIQDLMLLGLIQRVLIIGPVRVIQSTWPDEIQKWDHTRDMTYSVVAGTPKQRRKALEKDADIFLIGKENVCWLIDETSEFNFDMVVIDELSTFKNPRSQRFKALRRVMPRVNRFIGLTGTPAPRGIPDLWSQVYLMDRGKRLGRTLTIFRENYLQPGRRNGYIVYEWNVQPGADRRIYEAIGDICMSLDQKDCAELPPVKYLDWKVRLQKEVMNRYHAFKREKILSIDDEQVMAANAGVLCAQLKQITSGEVYTRENMNGRAEGTKCLHSTKLDALDDLLEAANGNPVLVFYWFQHEKERLLAHLQKDRKGHPRLEHRRNRGAPGSPGKRRPRAEPPAGRAHRNLVQPAELEPGALPAGKRTHLQARPDAACDHLPDHGRRNDRRRRGTGTGNKGRDTEGTDRSPEEVTRWTTENQSSS